MAGLFGLAFPLLRHHPIVIWPLATGAGLITCGLLAPRTLTYPYFVWDKLGRALGWLNSRLVLNILFFLVFAPAGYLARLGGWDPMAQEFDHDSPSYRSASEPTPRENMERPY